MVRGTSRLGVDPARGALRQAGRAFTLVELMVVLAIIAMLIGLLTLTIRDGIERAKSTRCRNNLRQYGIAIGKYKSDCNGYFPSAPQGGGIGAGETRGIAVPNADETIIRAQGVSGGYDLSKDYKDGLNEGVGAAYGYGWGSGYSPEFVKNYVMLTSEGNVTHCPKVDQEIFDTNSPVFKGCVISSVNFDGEERTIVYDDTAGAFASYAMSPYLGGRPNEGVIAFIDWNAPYGWAAAIGSLDSVAVWQMDRDTVGEAVRGQYQPAGTSKGTNAYLTEIGYHHRSSSNNFANYVAVDGHVGSLMSNAPYAEVRKLFAGN